MGWCYCCQTWQPEGHSDHVSRASDRGRWWHEWRCVRCQAEHGWDAADHLSGKPPVPVVFGVGYEGRTVEDLVDMLACRFVDEVADVRLSPISRKPHLSKVKLKARLSDDSGISYAHYPGLGNPSPNRAGYRAGDPRSRDVYSDVLYSSAGNEQYQALESTARRRRTAVLCACRARDNCHRSQILDRLAQNGFDVQEL